MIRIGSVEQGAYDVRADVRPGGLQPSLPRPRPSADSGTGARQAGA
ncbi:hypothetical protein HN031_05845 [Nocardioides sp. zg-1308]|uniref:Uncharacterized protein n=1 Tax=Nocardioides renjunii TaxID=3095075 RepID=A0ABU5K892_9ACTN|nr:MULTISPECIES: hypothetical protein [unclassified Nocardioides]MDZ5661087.1 hypothetical protein [Nocardioides sp. S-58]NPD04205.1 hypothetical protein [Nocardioides sp. zg-1308]WQQ22089.1 hypothetical protein SHK17_19650 [Nocardioides sp. S-34]